MATWYRSKAFLIVAGLVALVVATALAVPYFLNLDGYRPAIVDLLKRESGREVAIEKLGLELLPLEIEVVNFRLLNPAGFPAGETLAVERIGLGLAWRPLLRRQLQIQSVHFQGLKLNLLENDAGATNYDVLDKLQQRRSRSGSAAAGKPTQAGAAAAPPAIALTSIERVTLAPVELSAGRVRRRSPQVSPSWRLSGLSVEARSFDFTRPDWPKLIEAEVDMDGAELALPTLKEPLRFTRGQLQVKNYAASGEFTLALGTLRATGRVRLADLARPVVDFALAANELSVPDLAALLVAGEKGDGARASSTASPAPSRPRLVARGTVEVKKVSLPPLSAENLKAALRRYSTRLEIEPVSFSLYGGGGEVTTRIDLAQPTLPTEISLSLSGVDMGKLSAAANPEKKAQVAGTLEGKLDARLLLGAADTAGSLAGQGSFAVRDGTFPGLNIGRTLGALAKFLQVGLPEGDTRFRGFTADLRIAGKRIASQSIKLDAEGLELSAAGSAGFDKTLDYRGSAILQVSGPAAPAETDTTAQNPLDVLRRRLGEVVTGTTGPTGKTRLPFRLTGTTEQPKFSLTGLPQPVEEATENQTTDQPQKKRFRIF